MRNGNDNFLYDLLTSAIVLILPMRNGNFISPEDISVKDESSYPTYEEWKLIEESAT